MEYNKHSFQRVVCDIRTDQTVLFAVVQPVPGSPRSDDSLQLIGLHPNQLINTLVSVDKFMKSMFQCIYLITCKLIFYFLKNESKINELEEFYKYYIMLMGFKNFDNSNAVKQIGPLKLD